MNCPTAKNPRAVHLIIAELNPFMPTVPTFAVRETDERRQSLGQQMLERWAWMSCDPPASVLEEQQVTGSFLGSRKRIPASRMPCTVDRSVFQLRTWDWRPLHGRCIFISDNFVWTHQSNWRFIFISDNLELKKIHSYFRKLEPENSILFQTNWNWRRFFIISDKLELKKINFYFRQHGTAED